MQALSRQEEGQYDPHRVDWVDHLLGGTSSRRGRVADFLLFTQTTDSESSLTALQALTGTFFAPGSPWRARAVRARLKPSSSRTATMEGKGLLSCLSFHTQTTDSELQKAY